MNLKRTSSFNEKSTRRKKPISQAKRPEELNYSCDSKGNLTIWIKKTENYAPVTTVNKWHLLKLQMHLQETGKFPRVYKAIYPQGRGGMRQRMVTAGRDKSDA